MAWLDWAVDDPAPGNCGYYNVACEVDPSLRRSFTIHSVWGYFTYINPSTVMALRGNSWGATIMRSGAVWRHRPRPTFVNWHAGGPAQNIGTDGIEMEGKDEPWTDAQKESLLRVLVEAWGWFAWEDVALGQPTDKTQGNIRQTLLALPRGSLWEHNWFDYTSCPMGRDDWNWLIPALTTALVDEEDGMLYAIRKEGSSTVYASDLQTKWGIPTSAMFTEMKEKELIRGKVITLSGSLFDRIRPALTLTAIGQAVEEAVAGMIGANPKAIATAVLDRLAARLEG